MQVESIQLAEKSFDVFTIAMIEAKYGTYAEQARSYIRVFKLFNSTPGRVVRAWVASLFILVQFVPDDQIRLALDIACLLTLTCFTLVLSFFEYQCVLQGSFRTSTKLELGSCLIIWSLVPVQYALGVPLLAFVRPVMLFVASEQLTMTLVLFVKCCWDIQTVLLLFFMVVVLSAIAVHVLYWQRFGQDPNVDSLLDSFMAMFIFLESQVPHPARNL